MSDRELKHLHDLRKLPAEVKCDYCGNRAPFRNDHMAARYECEKCQHAKSADLVVKAK